MEKSMVRGHRKRASNSKKKEKREDEEDYIAFS